MQISKKNILAFLKQQDGAIHFAGILRQFGGRHVKNELKRMLDDMAQDGELVRFRGNSYALASAATSIRGKLSSHRDGYGFVTPQGGGEDIFIPQRHMRGAMHGDTVEVHAERSRMGGGKFEGRITSVVERGVSRVVGRYEETRRGAIVIPEETRLNLVIAIPPKGRGLAQDGQQVVVELSSYPVGGRPAEGNVVEVLGWPDDPEVEVQSAIRRFDLPHVFAPDTLAEAEAIPETVPAQELAGRVDLRPLATVTIDGETARDFDDAVSLRREGDNFRLWVSIADVSHYVRPDSPLDRDAYLRGTSVYFPDRCIPMLPERLSNGICSLNPGVERLTMTAEMLFDRDGSMLESSFYPGIIASAARLTYTQVKRVIVDQDRETADSLGTVTPMLLEMKELALILMGMRRKRGSIDFDLPESEVIIGLTGLTEGIVRAERTLAHQLIEEFMLAANEAVALFIAEKGIPLLYRIHENPDPAKLINFQEFAFGFGYEFPLKEERVNPADLQRLLESAAGRPEERMINYALLRCMKQARYAAENLHHFGLASRCYCHFTSPIRRYPDLVVHRILKALLALAENRGSKQAEKRLSLATHNLSEVGEHTSKRERVAMEAERDIVELKKAQFMQQHLGEEFDGFITGVTGFGFFVELEELFVEGLVHVSTLDDDLYTFVENRHSLVGRNRGRVLRIGDRARVRVASVSPATRRIEFVLVGHASSTPQMPLTTAGDGEFPRTPIRGKRLPGQGRERNAEGTKPSPAAGRREGQKRTKKGAVRTGGRKRR
ncbi:ribonuclease R [Pelobacter propionicus]|uniref:Ribonuclease R n=1 Tax=Pelobacter propionicus (strain DSM 2379 / NBRC 103807 / OttBd1) TaxID=338966 RepID=A1AN74_PELPD|nr:ribonuclease R [Pelobacter propionicus]ABK98794.1 RNAse R [Pelobacter propionicus DSM 2379]